MLTSITFSQNVIPTPNKLDTTKIIISVPVSKAIIKDLLEGDMNKEIVGSQDKTIKLLEVKSSKQDSVIVTQQTRLKNAGLQIDNIAKQTQIWTDEFNKVAKENQTLKRKLIWTKIEALGVILGTAYLYITK